MKGHPMANPDHIRRLRAGVPSWNSFRYANPSFRPDLSNADLSRTDLLGADLRDANLASAKFSESILNRACLTQSDLRRADFTKAALYNAYSVAANFGGADLRDIRANHTIFRGSDFSNADLTGGSFISADLPNAIMRSTRMQGCNLSYSNLAKSDLSDAQAQGAHFDAAILVEANLTRTNLAGASIHGIAAWDLTLKDTVQTDLRISKPDQPLISVDNIEVAQFVYLLLNSPKIREVIETVGRKLVLILGRFTAARKEVLEAVRDGLRANNYIPMLVDFDVPSNRDVTETVSTLAHMARFIVADITEPRSVPQELMAIVPSLPSVPVQPLLLESLLRLSMGS